MSSPGVNNDPQLQKVKPYTGDRAALLCILERSSDAGMGFVHPTWGLILIVTKTSSVTTGRLILKR